MQQDTPNVGQVDKGKDNPKTEMAELPKLKEFFQKVKDSLARNQHDIKLLSELKMHVGAIMMLGAANIEKDTAKFVFEELLPGCVKRYLLVKAPRDDSFTDEIVVALETIVSLFYQMLENGSEYLADMADLMRHVLDPKQTFYQSHYQKPIEDKAEPDQSTPEVTTVSAMDMSRFSPEECQWRYNLKPDDEVDAYKSDVQWEVDMWCRGRVTAKVHDIKTGIVTVTVKFHKDITVQEIQVPLDSDKIAPPKTKRRPDEWRKDLRAGDIVDAMDRYKVWYVATIIQGEVRDDPHYPNVKVGYRQYYQNGHKNDEMGNYDGMSKECDEPIGSYTVRIQTAHTFSTPGFKNPDSGLVWYANEKHQKKESATSNETILSAAPLYNEAQDQEDLKQMQDRDKVIFAIERERSTRSMAYVGLINKFGARDLFEKILVRLQDQESSLEFVYYTVAALVAAAPNFHKSFIDHYLCRLKDAVEQHIIKAEEKKVRLMKRERTDELVQNLWDKLMARQYPFFTTQVQKNIFMLKIGVMFMKQNFLEKRIEGAKLVDGVCKQAMSGATIQTTTSTSEGQKDVRAILSEALKAGNIFNEFFSKERCHLQLVMRSDGLLRFMISQRELSQAQLDTVWQNCSDHDSILIAFYKVLAEIASSGTEVIEFFIQKIITQPVESVKTQDVELLSQVAAKIHVKSEGDETVVAILKFFCQILFSTTIQIADNVKDKTQKAFSNLLSGVTKKVMVWPFLKMFVDDLKSQTNGYLTIKMLNKFIEEYVERTSESPDCLPAKKKDFIEKLDSDFQVLSAIFVDLQTYMAFVQTQVAQLTEEQVSQICDKQMFGGQNHYEQLQLRLSLIGNIIEQSTNMLTVEHLNSVWDCLIQNNAITFDHQHAYKFFRNLCDAVLKSQVEIINEQELIKFINSKIQYSQNFVTITMDGYHFFQTFFVLMNNKLKKLIILGDEGYNKQSKEVMTSYNNTTGAKYQAFKFGKSESSIEDPSLTEVMVKSSPNEMQGLQGLWQIAINCRDQKVGESVAKFLLQLYTNLDFGMESHITHYEDQFITQCFLIIKQQHALIEKRTPEEQALIKAQMVEKSGYYIKSQTIKLLPVEERRILKCLTYVKMLISNSEKDGTHNLKPHSALSQGELLNKITVNFPAGQQYNARTKFTIAVWSNCTIFELKKLLTWEIAQMTNPQGQVYYTVPPHPYSLILSRYSNSSVIKDTENGCTLAELKFRNSETLTIGYRNQQAESKVPLLNEEGTDINQRAMFIFDQMFHSFAVMDDEIKKPVMRNEEVCKFVSKATNEPCSSGDSRVANILKYDSNEDGRLERDDFIEFYRQSCFQKIQVVRNNLYKYNYNSSLRLMPQNGEDDNILQARKNFEQMPRFKIANDFSSFSVLFSLFSLHKEVCGEARSLVNMLSTQNALFWDILWLNDRPSTMGAKDWRTILEDADLNKVAYCLSIVDSFVTLDVSGWDKNSDEYKLRTTWVQRFLEQGGFRILYSQLERQLPHEEYKDDQVLQLLDLLVKLTQHFFNIAVQASLDPEVRSEILAKKLQEREDKEKKDESAPQQSQTSLEPNANNQIVVYGPQLPGINQPIQTINDDGTPSITQDYIFGDGVTTKSVPADQQKIEQKAANPPSSPPDFEDSNRFNEVVDSVRELNYHQRIFETMNSSEFAMKLVSMITKINIQASHEKQNSILKRSLVLWVDLVIREPALFDQFLEWKEGVIYDAKRFVFNGIYSFKAQEIRECFRDQFKRIAAEVSEGTAQRPLYFLFDTLLASFPAEVTKEEQEKAVATDKTQKSSEFFELMQALLVQINTEGANDTPFDLRQTLVLMINRMKNHVSSEKDPIWGNDRTLVGYITLTFELIKLYAPQVEYEDLIAFEKEHNLLHELFYSNLYYVPGKSTYAQQKKCIAKDSRAAAYKLLLKFLQFLKPKELAEFMEHYLWPMIKDLPTPNRWSHQPSSKSRNVYAGITNLGCICYMISILQQIYMVPQFRYLLLKAVDKQDEVWGEWRGRKIHDNLLVQFQRLFGHLELTEKDACDPTDFVYSYKDDGKPTNVGVQMDSTEFLNFFFDRIENQLDPTSQKYLVQDFFTFKRVEQRQCSGCKYVKNRIDRSYNLSVDVQHLSTLEASLNKLISTSKIEDYKCDQCNQKVDLMQQEMILNTPQVLCIQLKRFVFSFETLSNEKINTKLEFPTTLDLKQYSLKGVAEQMGTTEQLMQDTELAPYLQLDDDHFIYKLVGVNIHKGTATHGHYFSYINCARGKDEHDPHTKEAEWLAAEKDTWREFNDEEVKYFSFKELAKEAFGSLESSIAAKDASSGQSAYMLVYERKHRSAIRQVEPDGTETSIALNAIEKYVPKWLETEVQKSNIDFVIDKQVFDENFFILMKNIFGMIAEKHMMGSHTYGIEYSQYFDQLKAVSLEVGHRVLFDFISRFTSKAQLQSISEHLQSILLFTESHITYCSLNRKTTILVDFIKKHYLADNLESFWKIMFEAQDESARMHVVKFTARLVNRAWIIWGKCAETKGEEHERLLPLRETLVSLMEQLIYKMMDPQCHKNWSRLCQYFTLLLQIGTGGKYQTLYMLQHHNLVVDIADMMLGDKSPKAKNEKEKRVSMGGSVSTTPFGPLVALMSHLVRSMHTPEMLKRGVTLDSHTVFGAEVDTTEKKEPLSEKIEISAEAVEYLTNPDLFQQIMSNGYQETTFGQALSHICFHNEKLSKEIFRRLLKIIVFSDYDRVHPCIEIINNMLTIKDSELLQRKRLEWVFGFGFLNWDVLQDTTAVAVGMEMNHFGMKKEIFMMKSMLTYDPENNNSLLHLLWRYQGRMDQYTVNCLDDLTKVMAKDRGVCQYLAGQPGPTYQFARFTDWILPYVTVQSVSNDSSIKKTASTVLEQLVPYEAYLKEVDDEPTGTANILSCTPRSFVIVKQNLEKETFLEQIWEQEDVICSVSYTACNYVWSEPNGRTNLALGPKYADTTVTSEPQESKSAAAMLQERENQINTRQTLQNEAANSQTAASEQSSTGVSASESNDAWQGAQLHECADLIYKFTVNNNTDVPIMFKIKLEAKDPNQEINLGWPRTGIKGSLLAGESRVVCLLQKLRPDEPAQQGGNEIDKLNLGLSWKIDADKLEQERKRAERSVKNASVTFEEKVDTIQGVTTTNEIKTQTGGGADFAMQADYFGGGGSSNPYAEKQCGTCTVFNDFDAKVCHLCGANFP